MSETMDREPDLVQASVGRAVKKLDGPGVVFHEPLREAKHTLIPVSKVMKKGENVIAKPVAVIVVTNRRVKVEYFRPPLSAGLLWGFGISAVFGAASALFYPPWRPGESLLGDIRRLILTIRGKE